MEGHRVARARSGNEALALLRAGGFDLVVSDVRMPDLDGPGLHAEIERFQPALAESMVFITGDTFGDAMVAFFERTQATAIAKPFTVAELRAAIRRRLG